MYLGRKKAAADLWIGADEFAKINETEYSSHYTLSIPVFVRKKMIAILNLSPCETSETFIHKDEHILSIMLNEINFALENVMLYSRLEKQSQSLQLHADELTRVNERLQEAIEQKEKAKQAFEKANETHKRKVYGRKLRFAQTADKL